MNTFIIIWNTVDSSWDYKKFKETFAESADMDLFAVVSDWRKAHAGDRFFMVSVGKKGLRGKGDGIIMSGYFTSDPYVLHAEDSNLKGAHFVDLQPDYMFDTKHIQTLSYDFLTEQLPGIEWKSGRSGIVLDKVSAYKLEGLWAQCLKDNAEDLRNGRKWRTAQDVFKRFPRVELYNLHCEEGSLNVSADFYGGGLDVAYVDSPYDDSDLNARIVVPGSEPITTLPFFSIEITSLRKAFDVEDNRGVAARLRKDFMGLNGMKRLLEFAKKKGCRISEIEELS